MNEMILKKPFPRSIPFLTLSQIFIVKARMVNNYKANDYGEISFPVQPVLYGYKSDL